MESKTAPDAREHAAPVPPVKPPTFLRDDELARARYMIALRRKLLDAQAAAPLPRVEEQRLDVINHDLAALVERLLAEREVLRRAALGSRGAVRVALDEIGEEIAPPRETLSEAMKRVATNGPVGADHDDADPDGGVFDHVEPAHEPPPALTADDLPTARVVTVRVCLDCEGTGRVNPALRRELRAFVDEWIAANPCPDGADFLARNAYEDRRQDAEMAFWTARGYPLVGEARARARSNGNRDERGVLLNKYGASYPDIESDCPDCDGAGHVRAETPLLDVAEQLRALLAAK